VARELQRYLACGILAFGFARVHCSGCEKDELVAFSCKGRGFCPSCGARRIFVRAVLLEDSSGDYGGEGPWGTFGEFARAEAYYQLDEQELAREHLKTGEELLKSLEYYGEDSLAGSIFTVFCAEVSELVGD